MSPAPLASGEEDCRVAPGHLTGASRLSFELRQGPRSFAVSARIPLSEVTPHNNGKRSLSGAWAEAGTQATELLAAVRTESFGTYNSPEFSRKKQRLRSNLKSAQPARCRHCLQPGQAESGHRLFHCRLCGLDSRELPATPWCLWGGCSSPGMGVGLLEAATVYRETTAGVAC